MVCLILCFPSPVNFFIVSIMAVPTGRKVPLDDSTVLNKIVKKYQAAETRRSKAC